MSNLKTLVYITAKLAPVLKPTPHFHPTSSNLSPTITNQKNKTNPLYSSTELFPKQYGLLKTQ